MSIQYSTPSGVEIWLIYKCSECGGEHQATIKDTKFPGGVNCECGNEIRFKPIEKIRMKKVFKDEPEKKSRRKPKADKVVKGVADHLVVDGLKQMGYSAGEAKRLAEKYALYSVEDAIKLALTQG